MCQLQCHNLGDCAIVKLPQKKERKRKPKKRVITGDNWPVCWKGNSHEIMSGENYRNPLSLSSVFDVYVADVIAHSFPSS